MSISRLVFSEIRYRIFNFLLCLIAVVTASTLFVAGPTVVAGYRAKSSQELDAMEAKLEERIDVMNSDMKKRLDAMNKKTKRIMRDLGVNLRIVHRDTNMGNFYSNFAAVDFPESSVEKLATAPSINKIVHLVATLQHKLKWKDRTVLLVGTMSRRTVSQKNAEKPHMVKDLKEGTVIMGSELKSVAKEGSEIDINGVKLRVAKVQAEYGGIRDIQLMMHLRDAQKILKKPGKINQIMALNCKCHGDRISAVRKELEGILPNTKVTEHLTRATAREKQRDLVEKTRKDQIAVSKAQNEQTLQNQKSQNDATLRNQNLLWSITTVIVVFSTVVFTGVLAWLNVQQRRSEIGVLRALGKGTGTVVAILLSKSLIYGLIGGLVGCCIGTVVAQSVGSAYWGISLELLFPSWTILAGTILGAPLVAAMASYLPTLFAVNQDPAVVLMD